MSTSRPTKRPPLKWPPPPPQSPKILNFPRRHHRKQKPTSDNSQPIFRRRHRTTKKLEAIFDQDRHFSDSKDDFRIVLLQSSNGCEKREKIVEKNDEGDDDEEGDFGGGEVFLERERKERAVEVEMLRAECRFLRMERGVALKKVEKTRVWIKRILCSAVHVLLSGKEKIHEGRIGQEALEEEIEEIAEKLMMLQKSSVLRDFEDQNCSNFDQQVSVLQRRLEKLGGLSADKEPNLSIHTKDDESSASHLHCSKFKFTEMEVLRNKMQALSKGVLLDRMKEEYGSMLSTANSSAASSASNSRRMEYTAAFSASLREPHKETMVSDERETPCSGRCKAIVRRIVEQVRAESEQWSQMQEMLVQVKEEMEELQGSRNFWEAQAIESTSQIQSLSSSVQGWEQKALISEAKASDLQAQVSLLQAELEKTKTDKNRQVPLPRTIKPPSPTSRDEQNEKEKRVLICRLKENHHISSSDNKQNEILSNDGRRRRVHTSSGNGVMAPKRSPFKDVGNSSSPSVKQNGKAIFLGHCHRGSDEM